MGTVHRLSSPGGIVSRWTLSTRCGPGRPESSSAVTDGMRGSDASTREGSPLVSRKSLTTCATSRVSPGGFTLGAATRRLHM